MAGIALDDVTVEFSIYGTGSRSLKKSLVRLASAGRAGRGWQDRLNVRALDHVSVALRDGDRVALVGRNGAGKTTLLRVLAGVYEPTTGRINREGRVSPLFDVALGMNPEATGYENIRIRGLFLGMDRAEIESRIREIADFSELGAELERPMRTYSSGMTLRLAFAISTSVMPEILLMDEWIGVGDANFLAKAQERLEGLVRGSSIMVLASHADDIVRRLCNKAMLLEGGRLLAFGAVDEVLERYHEVSKTPLSMGA